MKKAFTLAEIMIVLTVIGILTAILLPVAFHSTPDEAAMKFKKANANLGTLVREMVSSEKYYNEGDFGKTASGGDVADVDYFCRVFADLISTKEVNCFKGEAASTPAFFERVTVSGSGSTATETANDLAGLDTACETVPTQDSKPAGVTTVDGVFWYEASPGTMFSAKVTESSEEKRVFSDPSGAANFADTKGFDNRYKVFCIDVDGNGSEAPFGYGIRADGKILAGARALEWINKSIQTEG